MLHGPNVGGLCCFCFCDLLRRVSFTGVLCGGLCVSSVCLVLCLCGLRVSVFDFWSVCVNFGELGFDSPMKLVPGGPRFLVDPTLRHCTFSHALD